jgi:hypothetical protein
LDDYFEPKAGVDLIKLDIQGYELHALRGAKRVLSDNPAIKLLVEFWPFGLRTAGSSPEVLLEQIWVHRFRIEERGTKRTHSQRALPFRRDDLL